MPNSINALDQINKNRESMVAGEPFAEKTPNGLMLHGIKAGDQIRIRELGGFKHLYVNHQPILQLRQNVVETHLLVQGDNLSREALDIRGEEEAKTTVRLLNSKGQILEEFSVENEKVEEKGLAQKIVDSGIRGSISPTKISIGKEWKFY